MDNERKAHALNKLMVAEAINYAYVGSQPPPKGKVNRGANAFKRWREKLLNSIYPNRKIETVWDRIKKRGKSIKLN
jgi:hypothetical protein